jgi:transcriptional regulator
MYVSKINEQQNAEEVQNYIEENGFATMISQGQDHFISTHTPLVLKKEGQESYLYGHISIVNEQVASIKNGEKMLAIFMENHTYISSSWYDHVNVPTWNYIAVHVQGTFEKLDDEATAASLHDLVTKYEKYSSKPFKIEQMGEEGFKREMRGIIGFRIKVTKIDASWKLSQNRDDKNYYEIIKKLKERGDDMSSKIAKEMEAIRIKTTSDI